VEHVYPLDQFKEAFKQSLKSHRTGKILFTFSSSSTESRIDGLFASSRNG
jgi:hypothetical protein